MRNNRLWKLADRAGKWIILSSVVLLVKGASYIFQTYLIARFLSALFLQTLTTSQLMQLMLQMGLLIAIKSVVSIFESRLSYRVSRGIKLSIRGKIFDKIRQMGPGYVESSGTAEILSNTVEGVEAMELFYSRFLPQLFYSLVIPLLLFGFAAQYSLLSAAILLAAVPVIPLSMVFISKWAKKSMGKFWEGYGSLSSTFLDNLQGMVTLKLFNKSEKRLKEMESQSWDFRNATMNLLKMQLTSITVMDTLVYSFAGIGILTALMKFHSGAIDLFGVIILLLLSVEFFLPVRKLGSYFHAGVNGIQAGIKISNFLEQPLRVMESEKPREPRGSDIRFNDLSFSYGDDDDNSSAILRGAEFHFEPGKVYGISGASGCGKSTLGQLMMRFYDADSGSIEIGGVDIRDIPLSLLRSKVTLVGSKSVIFDGSIADNLRLAKPDATEAQMVEACNRAGLAQLISDSPQKLQKSTGEKGALLSGGEKQRLSLARAILMNPDIYIFDEVTGSVDGESERIISETLYNLPKDKTIIIISHRKAIIEQADCHITIKEGRIVPVPAAANEKTRIREEALYEI